MNELATPEFSFLREIPQAHQEKKKWHCTGAYLQKHRPDIYEAVLQALCEPGVSIRAVCRGFGCSDHTIAAILAKESENLAALKKSRLGTARYVQRLALDRIAETVPTASCKEAGIVYGIITEKVELESGNATHRIESIDGGRDLHRKFIELHEALMKRADVTEIPSHIGLAGENGATKAPLLGAGDAPPIMVESDSHSDDSASTSEETKSTPANLNTISAAKSALPRAAGSGAGGVVHPEPPPSNSNP